MLEIPLQGSIADNSVPSLLMELYRQHYSGSLLLESQRTHKKLLFLEGAPVACESELARETLCLQLVEAGALAQGDVARVQQAMERKGYEESSALLELGLLEPRDLFAALKEQVRRRTIASFPWREGSYQLTPSEVPDDRIRPFRADPIELVQEGLETSWEVDRVLAGLAPRMNHFPVATRALAGAIVRLRQDEATQVLLTKLDGRCSLANIVAEVVRSPMALAATWVIDASGLVRYDDCATTGPLDDEQPELEIEFRLASDSDAAPATFELESETDSADQQSATAAHSNASSHADASNHSSEAVAMRSEILALLEQLDDLDFYEILEISRDARTADVKRAYFKAAKRYHPDSLARLGLGSIKQPAAAVFSRMAEAYEVLSSDPKRADYDAALDSDGPDVDVELLAQAETFFRKGEILVRMGDFRGALQFLDNAVQLWPDESNYQSTLGWALYKKTPAEPERAREHLEKALELTPDDAVVHFRLGMVLRALGESEAAQQALARAKQLDPSASESR
jgi:curved DNA-binding protein CbpA